jgi:hypothetical protein
MAGDFNNINPYIMSGISQCWDGVAAKTVIRITVAVKAT